MVDSGLSKGDASRITAGWQMLQRNFEKTTSLVKDFLSFAKGRLPELHPTEPNVLARDIVALYVDAARLQGVELKLEPGVEVDPAPLDAQGMETASLICSRTELMQLPCDGRRRPSHLAHFTNELAT